MDLLRRVGIEATADPQGGLQVQVGRGRETFRIAHTGRLSTAAARDIAARWSSEPARGAGRPLLAITELSSSARAVLRDARISWAERDTGVLSLLGDRVLVRIELSNDRLSASSRRLRSAELRFDGVAGILVEALLTGRVNPERFHLAELAEAGGAAHSWAHYVVSRLTKLGIATHRGAGRWRTFAVSDRSALLDAWLAAGAERPTTTTGLYVYARSPGEVYRRFAAAAEHDIRCAVGGIAAANLRAPSLTSWPDPALWIPAEESVEAVSERLGAEIASEGANVMLWQVEKDAPLRFAERIETPFGTMPVVSGPRAFLEARDAAGRGSEVAENLRQILGF
ncbi:MAG: hypothetical protein IRZ00_08370 [Gemmatimonadetes bacterium]|nr:hypothetical protein [Gemmatimonadota bacterium]